MSLSQKHAGLILVPWFNSDEWRYVYKLVYSGIKEKQEEALNWLKIWKVRTPILSTGVEGTLILLEALVIESESLLEEQIANLYAVALMRFLNLSAANSDKQGTFAKTSSKNELPKWLTNLRHDIAHGHQIPSGSNLRMGLDYGFNWLKEKYWEPQSKNINDYYIYDEGDGGDTLTNSLKVYVEINVNIFENTELDDEFYENIKSIIYKKYKRKNIHPHFMLEIFLQMIRQNVEKDVKSIGQCLDILVTTKAMLRPDTVIVSEEGIIKLDEKFVNIWTNFLNLLHYHGQLFGLAERLFDIIGDVAQSEYSKKVAALWIDVIFVSLHNLRNPEVSVESPLRLEKNHHFYIKESLDFQNKFLYFSAEESNQTMTGFLNSLLKYNLSNKGFSLDVINLSKAKSDVGNLHAAEDKVYTIDDLKAESLEIDDVELIECNEIDMTESCSENVEKIVGGKRWKKIEDTTIFKNCPLGVLPHQLTTKHPFLILA